MNEWYIQSEYIDEFSEQLYWSNDLGWVDKESATIFTDEEHSMWLDAVLHGDSQWIKKGV